MLVFVCPLSLDLKSYMVINPFSELHFHTSCVRELSRRRWSWAMNSPSTFIVCLGYYWCLASGWHWSRRCGWVACHVAGWDGGDVGFQAGEGFWREWYVGREFAMVRRRKRCLGCTLILLLATIIDHMRMSHGVLSNGIDLYLYGT